MSATNEQGFFGQGVASEVLLFFSHWFGARRFDHTLRYLPDDAVQGATSTRASDAVAKTRSDCSRTSSMSKLRREMADNFKTARRSTSWLQPRKPSTDSVLGIPRVHSTNSTCSQLRAGRGGSLGPVRSMSDDCQIGPVASLSSAWSADVAPPADSLDPVRSIGSDCEIGPVVSDPLSLPSIVPAVVSQVSKQQTGMSSQADQQKCFDFDLENFVNAEVSGPLAMENLLWQHLPLFVIFECILVSCLWAILPHTSGNAPEAEGHGLESVWPGQTSFKLQEDCQDLRLEAWRWLTYQFTHVGWMHLAANIVLTMIAGIPLEGFHGHITLVLIFNLGVAFGAIFHATLLGASGPLVGMSAGAYALLGMHFADTAINWSQTRYRYIKLSVLIVLITADVAASLLAGQGLQQVSHASHLGGVTSGLLLGILIGRNLKVKRFERILQAVALLLICGIVLSSGYWIGFQWPPRAVWQEESWCWVRQVQNTTLFPDRRWHCVFCETDACISAWSLQPKLAPVRASTCPEMP